MGRLSPFKPGNLVSFADQGVTFQVGDEVIVVGFYQAEQFTAGDITQVATGLRVLLRDPNGRPLWAGSSNNGGGGNGGGNGGRKWQWYKWGWITTSLTTRQAFCACQGT